MIPDRLSRVASLAGAVLAFVSTVAPADDAKDVLIVETILRLEDFDLNGSEKAQAAVARYLENHWAGERYLDLVQRFVLKEEAPGVLRLALEQSDSQVGAEAAAVLVKIGSGELLAQAIRGEDNALAVKAAKAIAHAGDSTLLAELSKVVADTSRSAPVRAAALSAEFGPNAEKHPSLLEKVKAGELAADLRQTAAELLMLSRDPKVREEAQTLFAAGEADFPPVTELVKRSGDPTKGKQLFATKTCMVCHEASGVGINFGPGLSEIGDKLNKEALFAAIMDPSAAISMGFEGWEITLSDGTLLLGMVEESENSVTVKMIGGAGRSVPKSEVASKKKLAQSLMYPGLHRMMTANELVDLVEYLSSLRKK